MTATARTLTPDDNNKPLISARQLAVDFAHLEKAVAELEALANASPPVLEDDDDLGVVNDLVPRLIGEGKRVEKQRKDTGRPFLDATGIVNGYFSALSQRLTNAQGKLEVTGKKYLDKKAAIELQRRIDAAAEATRIANEATAKAAEAVKTGDVPKATSAAVAADTLQKVANVAESAVAAPRAADLARTSVGGATATLKENWKFEIEDLNIIDLELLRPFLTTTAIEQAMRGFVRAGRRQIKGARIFKETEFSATKR